jgi:hypothetical protein
MASKKIKINRAPVLTLWATVVARRLGHDEKTALTLGKAVAGLNAQSKGRKLGIYEEKSEEEKAKESAKKKPVQVEFVEILGRGVPAIETKEGLRAAIKGEAIQAESVQAYLEQKFKDLEEARKAMEHLARAFAPKQLEKQAYDLYEKFRPKIPEGKKGWGAKGELDLDYIRSLAE